MKKVLLYTLFIPLLTFSQSSDFIHVDQFGYKTNDTKVAVISNPQIGFNASNSFTPSNTLEVRNANTNTSVFTGSPTQWNNGNTHSQSGDAGWWFDFSSLSSPGDYYIFDAINNESSAVFTINDNVYQDILIAATKMFYYNRCGIAKTTPYVLNGYQDPIAFTQDANTQYIFDQGNTALEKDMTGGWFDAGDYNKYVTFAETAVHDLLWAYRLNPSAFGDNFNIPESGNGIPDIIDEIKWETDWLLKMINTDGSVHIKMGARNFSENAASPPSSNIDTRYYGPVCTSAALAASNMLAHAAKVFQEFSSLTSYAATLEDKAIDTWNWVLPYLNSNTLQENCDDGSIVAGDADRTAAVQRKMALTAAAYLFDLTNDNNYNQYLIDNLNDTELINNGQWDNYNTLNIDALLHYTTLANADTTTKSTILNAAAAASNNNFNNYFGYNELDLYRGYSNDWTYHWGSSSSRANMGNLNLIYQYYNITSETDASYITRANGILHYFHGVNPLGLVQLSNMYSLGAEKSVNQLYHGWFNDGTIWDDAINSTYGPPPGFVTGGANQNYTANTSLSPPYNQPPQKSYLDFNTGFPDNSWEISEPAIYYQAAYVRLLARLITLNEDGTLSINKRNVVSNTMKLFPNPSSNNITINSVLDTLIDLSIVNIQGQVVNTKKNVSTNKAIDISELSSGVYLVKVISKDYSQTLKLIKN